MTKFRFVPMFLYLLIACAGVEALPPTVVLGTYGDAGTSTSVTPAGAPYADARMNASFGWRAPLPGAAYLALAGATALRYYVLDRKSVV